VPDGLYCECAMALSDYFEFRRYNKERGVRFPTRLQWRRCCYVLWLVVHAIMSL